MADNLQDMSMVKQSANKNVNDSANGVAMARNLKFIVVQNFYCLLAFDKCDHKYCFSPTCTNVALFYIHCKYIFY